MGANAAVIEHSICTVGARNCFQADIVVIVLLFQDLVVKKVIDYLRIPVLLS